MKNTLAFLVLTALFASAAQAQNISPEVIESLVQTANEKRLADSQEWRRLLHYRKNWFGGSTSEADGASFFTASDGRKNPQAELDATIRSFFSLEKRKMQTLVGLPDLTPRCQFPARYEFLNRELGLDRFVPAQKCEDYEKFVRMAKAKSVTLVFSSYHVNNPSSAYGHSLIRLNKTAIAGASEHQQLLDIGLNYAAVPSTKNPVLYAWFGLAGGFPGAFSTMPYYFKVREYSDFEARDLWEYDLNMTQTEVDRLVAHVWELASTYFDYFYLTENCSYHMLTLLEVAVPRINVVERVPFYVIPTDTLKAVAAEPDFVREIQYRPSLETQFRARLATLPGEDQRLLRQIVKTKDRSLIAQAGTPERQARLADAYIDNIDLNYAEKLMAKDPEASRMKQDVLIARSRLPAVETLKIAPPLSDSPEKSHGSARMTLYRNESARQGGSTGLSMRFALQDLTDVTTGMPEDSVIQFFNFHGRWWDREKTLRLEDLTLFEVATFAPMKRFSVFPSWRFRLGAERNYDPRCENCVSGSLKVGGGGTVELLSNPRLTAYALLDTALQVSPGFRDGAVSVLAGPSVGVRARLFREVYWLNEIRYLRGLTPPVFEDRRLESTLRATTPGLGWALEMKGAWGQFDEEVSFGLAHYF
jgi:Domain of unknown function (DUF4105)